MMMKKLKSAKLYRTAQAVKKLAFVIEQGGQGSEWIHTTPEG